MPEQLTVDPTPITQEDSATPARLGLSASWHEFRRQLDQLQERLRRSPTNGTTQLATEISNQAVLVERSMRMSASSLQALQEAREILLHSVRSAERLVANPMGIQESRYEQPGYNRTYCTLEVAAG